MKNRTSTIALIATLLVTTLLTGCAGMPSAEQSAADARARYQIGERGGVSQSREAVAERERELLQDGRIAGLRTPTPATR